MSVILGPWPGTDAKVEHDDRRAEVLRSWAAAIEERLQESDDEWIRVDRDDLETIAKNHRIWEEERLAAVELLRPNRRAGSSPQGRTARSPGRERDRGWNEYFKLRDQLKRERKGTPLDTLALDAKTRGHLWSANIATVEELRKVTSRPDWLIKGIGQMRRQEIIDALKGQEE